MGTSKGHLVMYNEAERRRSSLMGKATKRICQLAISRKGCLAVGSDDMHVGGGLGHSFRTHHACVKDPYMF